MGKGGKKRRKTDIKELFYIKTSTFQMFILDYYFFIYSKMS